MFAPRKPKDHAKMGLPMKFFLDVPSNGLSPESIDIMKKLVNPDVSCLLGADEVKAHLGLLTLIGIGLNIVRSSLLIFPEKER